MCFAHGKIPPSQSAVIPLCHQKRMLKKNSTDSPAAPPVKRRRGRPRKIAAERREHPITIYLNDEEFRRLEARRGERRTGDYLRMVAISGAAVPPLVPAVNRQEYLRLYELEARLTALEVKILPAESSLPTEVAEHLWTLLCQTRDEVVALRRALLGMGA